ncbi:hypothetical protein I551_0510 [Mycobacterium ulcerans str. Harvey]|uniref:Uncharacterized protein n=1 Tax=Mycobacterium ulcerans str. Harvey TaxID=1299332 RepID=A0ABP3AP10_MYCUL|nr:hypothetical protein I551_0510 [Mycobacterium ulcerans str. Harvey]
MAEWPEELAPTLTGAVALAREAVEEFSGAEAVGDYLGVSYEDPNAATHRFLAHLPGYQGWQWAAVVASYVGADRVTVSEVVLVPAQPRCWRRPGCRGSSGYGRGSKPGRPAGAGEGRSTAGAGLRRQR